MKTPAEQTFRLGEIVTQAVSGEDYLSMQSVFKDHTANDDKTSTDEDGSIKLRAGAVGTGGS